MPTLSDTSLSFSFSTNVPGTTQALYVAASSPPLTQAGFTSSTPVTDTNPQSTTHSVSITGLSPATTYQVLARSVDGWGNVAVSAFQVNTALGTITPTLPVADIGTLGQNPPDPAELLGWQVVTDSAYEPYGYTFDNVAPVTDVGQQAVKDMDYGFQLLGQRVPTVWDADGPHNSMDMHWTYVSWPDAAHQVDGAEWVHDWAYHPYTSTSTQAQPRTIHTYELPGMVTYIRHRFWVPQGEVSSPPSLEFRAVDIAREVWLNGTLVYLNNADYNTAFADYDGHSIDINPDQLLPGQWNLLAFKIQHHVNVVERILGPYWNNRQPFDVSCNPCADAREDEQLLSVEVPGGATQMSVQMLTPHLGSVFWNDPRAEDNEDRMLIGILNTDWYPLWQLPQPQPGLQPPYGPEGCYRVRIADDLYMPDRSNLPDVPDPSWLDGGLGQVGPFWTFSRLSGAPGQISPFWIFDRMLP